MINDWEELDCINDPMHAGYNELKLWLRSQTQTTTVSTTSHPIHMLRAILHNTVHEIRENLDQQIGMLIMEAQTYHIRVLIEDYYRTRADDWDGGEQECGAGLHLSPLPTFALPHPDDVMRFVACPVRVG